MSEDDKKLMIEKTTDFTDNDFKRLETFMADGLPGLAPVAADTIKQAKMLELYLSGKTYRQINMITNVPLSIILYMSHKAKWFEARREYFTELAEGIKARVLEAKVINQDFVLQLIQLFQKTIGDNTNNYLRTGDEKFLQKIDPKNIDRYFKALDYLIKISADPKVPVSPVGLNLGEGGVTITRKSNNEVEITPKQQTMQELLHAFAESVREEENEEKNKKD